MDGNFTLNVGSKDAILEISYIGYQGQSLKVTPGKTLSVVLKEDTQSLDEVVVVGFGVQKKANLTGAVSQVKMDDVLGSRPAVNAMSALQGAMPGLQITPNNDAAGPGQSKSFNIRGTTSINGGGSVGVDRYVPGDIDMLNPGRYRKCFCVERCCFGCYSWCACRFRCNTCDYKEGEERRRVSCQL